MVPIKEMTDVLKVIKETTYLKPKQWVRLKRGIFRDDLAQVRPLLAVELLAQIHSISFISKTYSIYIIHLHLQC